MNESFYNVITALRKDISSYKKQKFLAGFKLLRFWKSWESRKKEYLDFENKADDIDEVYRKLLKISEERNIDFEYCSFPIFKSHYQSRLKGFLKYNPDGRERDFAQMLMEIEDETFGNAPELIKDTYEISHNRKKEFLLSKTNIPDETLNPAKKSQPYKQKSLSNLLTVRLLDHLGVIDHLLQKGYTSEKIAKIVAEIQGKHYKNISIEISHRSKPMPSKDLEGKLEEIINRIDKL